MWSAVEVNVGIICACIPTLKPLVGFLLPRMLGDVSEARGVNSGPPNSGLSDNASGPSYFRKANARPSTSEIRLTSSRPSSGNGGEPTELKQMQFASDSGNGFDHGVVVRQTFTVTSFRPENNRRVPAILAFGRSTG